MLKTDEGSYICQVDNGVGEPLQKIVQLLVYGTKRNIAVKEILIYIFIDITRETIQTYKAS